MIRNLKTLCLCICFGIAFAALFEFWQVQTSDDPAPRVFYDLITNHLKAFQKGDFSSAYAMASNNLKSAVSEKQFATLMKQYGLATFDYRFVEFGPSICEGNKAQVDIRGVAGKNGGISFRYYFIRENGKWKVESFQFCSEPKRPPRLELKSI